MNNMSTHPLLQMSIDSLYTSIGHRMSHQPTLNEQTKRVTRKL